MLAGAGFSSTSLRMMRTVPGSPQYTLADPRSRREAKQAIAESGVTVLMIELVPLGPALDMDALNRMLEAGAEIGATRVMTAGDDEDLSVVAAKLAQVCELGRGYGLAVDLEFMPFRPVRTLGEAKIVLATAGQVNAFIVLDALHFFRSKGSFEDLRATDPALFSLFQICDAPSQAPADLTFEARNARVLPGAGELDLDGLMAAIPEDLPIAVEVPLMLSHPHLTHRERLKLSATATWDFLSRRRSEP